MRNSGKEKFMLDAQKGVSNQMLYNIKRLIELNKKKLGLSKADLEAKVAKEEERRKALIDAGEMEKSFEVKNNFESFLAMADMKAHIDTVKVREENLNVIKTIIEQPFENLLSTLTDGGKEYMEAVLKQEEDNNSDITQYELYQIVKKQKELLYDTFVAKMTLLKLALQVEIASSEVSCRELVNEYRYIDLILGNLPEDVDYKVNDGNYVVIKDEITASAPKEIPLYETLDIKDKANGVYLIKELIHMGILDKEYIHAYVSGASILVGNITGENSFATIIDKAVEVINSEIDNLDLTTETWKDIFGKVEDADNLYQEPIHTIKSEQSLIVILRRVQALLAGMISPQYLSVPLMNGPRLNKLNHDESIMEKYIKDISYVALAGSKDIHDRIISEYKSGQAIVASIIFQLFTCRLIMKQDIVNGIDVFAKSFLSHTGETWEKLAQKIEDTVKDLHFEKEEIFDAILNPKKEETEETK